MNTGSTPDTNFLQKIEDYINNVYLLLQKLYILYILLVDILTMVQCSVLHEAVEFQRLTEWKWWKKKPVEFDESEAKEELIDIWHFVVDASIELGMTPQHILDEYLRKTK